MENSNSKPHLLTNHLDSHKMECILEGLWVSLHERGKPKKACS